MIFLLVKYLIILGFLQLALLLLGILPFGVLSAAFYRGGAFIKLSNRRQAVKINDYLSVWISVNGGVPQGAKFGPVLFFVMINDLKLRSAN